MSYRYCALTTIDTTQNSETVFFNFISMQWVMKEPWAADQDQHTDLPVEGVDAGWATRKEPKPTAILWAGQAFGVNTITNQQKKDTFDSLFGVEE
jgi:hypothetical protein